MKDSIGDRYASIRIIGFVFFLAASAFCVYKIYELNSSDESTNHFPATYSTKLKLVSVFQRHGDRGPSDKIIDVDRHREIAPSLWPYGLANLTQTGEMRQFHIGLELRNRYEKFLSYNASHFLAFSSPITRCQQSLSDTLRGLFDIEMTVPKGRKQIERYNLERGDENKFCFKGDDLVHDKIYCSQQQKVTKTSRERELERSKLTGLPTGSGFPLEYTKIKMDLTTVPVLTWEYLTECKWRKDNPTPVDPDLFNSKAVAQLKGVNKLVKLLKDRYKIGFNFTTLGLWSTMSNEILLARTKETIGYADHLLDWVNTPLPEYRKSKLSLYDLWEQVSLLGYRDRIAGTANYIQFGPIITSLVRGQSVALERQHSSSPSTSATFNSNTGNSNNNKQQQQQQPIKAQMGDESVAGTFADGELYRDKKMIIYSSHDSILQQLMMNLSLIQFEPEDFETRFNKWHKADGHQQFLHGLRMASYGLSLVFELYETELRNPKDGTTLAADVARGNLQMAAEGTSKKFPFIQALLYNQADAKYKPVQYKRLMFGAACRAKFRLLNQALPRAQVDAMLSKFYSNDFPLDKDLSCPFELFKNVTSAYMMQPAELTKLCAN